MVVAAAATSARRPIGKLFGFYRPLFDLRLLCRRLKHNFQCLCCVQSMMIVDINHLVVLPIRHLIRVWPCILLKRASICVQWSWTAPYIHPNICENFDPFYSLNMTLWYSKHILSHCVGSQKCIFNAFKASAVQIFDRFVTEHQRQ